MDNPGSVLVLEYGLQTLTPQPTGIAMSNQTETQLVGEDYDEFNSTFDLILLGYRMPNNISSMKCGPQHSF